MLMLMMLVIPLQADGASCRRRRGRATPRWPERTSRWRASCWRQPRKTAVSRRPSSGRLLASWRKADQEKNSDDDKSDDDDDDDDDENDLELQLMVGICRPARRSRRGARAVRGWSLDREFVEVSAADLLEAGEAGEAAAAAAAGAAAGAVASLRAGLAERRKGLPRVKEAAEATRWSTTTVKDRRAAKKATAMAAA